MKNLSIIIITMTAMFSFESQASWIEFCYVTGTIEKIVSSGPNKLIFDLKVEAAEKFSPEENLNSYVNCKDYVGKTSRIHYDDKALKIAGDLSVGMSHCAKYEHVDFGDGGLASWFPGCDDD